tara:strand:+ start:372 stop:1637 length:1266 start_codon:yes stop_codon:yes gene_type:complete
MAETKRDEWRRAQSLKEKNQAVQNEMDEAMERHRKRDLGWFRATAPEYAKEEDGTITYKIKVPPKKKNNEGGLLVPREGYAKGRVVVDFIRKSLQEALDDKLLVPSKLEQRTMQEDFTDSPYLDELIAENKYHISTLENEFLGDLDDDDLRSGHLKYLAKKLKTKIYSNVEDTVVADDIYAGKLMELYDNYVDKITPDSKETEISLNRTESNIDREEMEDPTLKIDKDKDGQLKLPFQEGGMPVEEDVPVDTYPNIPPEEMAEAKASQLPDNEMEDEYIDFILDESLNNEEQMYLMNTLEADDQLSIIFDKLIGTASEFSGAGEVEGPGTGVSDSIPARLSDGEFVMTKKATDAIGPENLQSMMDEAEMAYDIDGGRELKMAFGGVVEDDELEDSDKDYLSKTDEEIKKVMIGANKMPSVR